MFEIVYDIFNYLNCNTQCTQYIYDYYISINIYWIIVLLFTYLDYIEPKWYIKYKIQKNKKISIKRIVKLIKQNLFNQLCITPIFLIFWYKLLEWRILDINEPTFYTIISHFIIYFITAEFLFYHIHFLLHHPILFKWIHKHHHDEPNTVSLNSYNNHFIEHLLSGLFTMNSGHLIMGSHKKVFKYWSIGVVLVSIVFHCGVHLPLLFPNEFHDYHHLKYNQCYGVFGLFDYLYGTDKEYKKSKQYKRQKVYTLNEEYPLI